jgi:tRNA modification GTPase
VVDAGAGLDACAPPPRAPGEAGVRQWTILNKTDLLAPDTVQGLVRKLTGAAGGNPALTISASSGAGVDDLVRRLGEFAQRFFTAEPALVTRERHRVALHDAGAALDGALRLGPRGGEELVAEQIRLATRALERLTGRIGVEDILDVIFRDFCIGK